MKALKWVGIVFGCMILIGVVNGVIRSLTTNDTPKKEVTTRVEVPKDNGIEGLNAVDIYLNLEEKGYTIDKQYTSKEGTLYYCDKKEIAIEYNVTMFKNTNDKVEEVKISATLTGLENKKIIAVKPFLKYVSTVQYEGSNNSKITRWIEDNFNNDKASIIIGQAKFSIFAPSEFTRLVLIEKA